MANSFVSSITGSQQGSEVGRALSEAIQNDQRSHPSSSSALSQRVSRTFASAACGALACGVGGVALSLALVRDQTLVPADPFSGGIARTAAITSCFGAIVGGIRRALFDSPTPETSINRSILLGAAVGTAAGACIGPLGAFSFGITGFAFGMVEGWGEQVIREQVHNIVGIWRSRHASHLAADEKKLC